MSIGSPLELAGRTFGALTVIGRAPPPDRNICQTAFNSSWWSCRCECGVTSVKSGPELSAGRINTCGEHLRGTAAGSARWDCDTILKLQTLWAQGLSTSAIGALLGFSKNAIVSKARRVSGCDARPSPIRRDASAPRAAPPPPRSVGPTLPPLPSDKQTAGIARMAEIGCRPAVIAQAMNLDVRTVKSVVPSLRPAIMAQKPLPVSLVPIVQPMPSSGGGCQFPAWKNSERPKFHADGNPLVCGNPATRGPYCAAHRAVCYTKTPPRRLADAA